MDLLAGLNPAQRAAAEAVRGPVCILAGAGTGKTRTITHRIAHQVASGVARADQVLAVTFTDRAAGELRARLAGMGIPGGVRAATFHAAAWAQLRYFWAREEAGPLPDVLASKVGLLIRAARRWGVEARDLAAEIEWAKARRLDPDEYRAAAADREGPLEAPRMATVYTGYEAAKAEANQIDYEDMLLRVTDLLERRDDIAAEVRDRYRYLTVDEFQDVNPAQWALLRAWLGDRDDVCVVGDDDQMIYSFTGATSGYLTGFRDRFPQAKVVTLTENYRSTREVLALANGILWTKPRGLRKRLTSLNTGGPAPSFRGFDDADGEVDGVLGEIRRLHADLAAQAGEAGSGSGVAAQAGEAGSGSGGVPYGEMAIVYRVNAQSEAWEEALRDAEIPVVVRGDGGFFDRPEVRQALRALRGAAAAEPPEPEPGPGGALPATPPRADRAVERVLRDALSWHPRTEPAGEAARERWRSLGALLDAARRLVDDQPGRSLAEVVAALDARAAAGADTVDGDGAVTLLTFHKAKGLEFDAVFCVSLEDGLLPISHAKTEAAVEEERRLLYVGATRARRHLWLSWATSRPGWSGRVQSRRPSRLLYNLAPDAPQSGRAKQKPVAGVPATAKPAKKKDKAKLFADCDPELVERLRAWRADRARSDEVPAYVVFADRTLAELAVRRPSGLSDLRRVHGFGPAKVDRYGEDLLAVMHRQPSAG